jgi:hypothetical protein
MSTPNVNEVNAGAAWAGDNTNENLIDNNAGIETDKQSQEIKKVKDVKAEIPVKEEGGKKKEVTKAFCVKCRTMHVMKDPKLDVLKNNKYALKGQCESCNSTVFKIIKKEEGQKLKSA